MEEYTFGGEEIPFFCNCTNPTFKAAAKGIMVWACLCTHGVGKIMPLEGKVNADVYLNILKDVAVLRREKAYM